MRVLKFGGTSVGNPQRMKNLVEPISPDSEEKKIVVLSAFSGVTNKLVTLSKQIDCGKNMSAEKLIHTLQTDFKSYASELFKSTESLRNAELIINQELLDVKSLCRENSDSGITLTRVNENAILAIGEKISTAFLQLLLEERGYSSALISALDFMKIDSYSEPDLDFTKKYLSQILDQSPDTKCFITQGFICRNAQGEIDNLQRGGSDYTATIIGSALKAEEIQIWTDIDGMHNNDPRIIANTRPITRLSFEEAGELAYFGAKILHPTCILPAKKNNVPVRIKNTLDASATGTLISHESVNQKIKAIAAKDGITAVKIKSERMLQAHGFLKRIFEIFATHKTSVDMITTSEVAVSLTIDDDSQLPTILEELHMFSTVEVDTSLTIICVVGDFIADHKGYGQGIFNALSHVPIRMISYGGSKHNISLLVNSSDKENALVSLNNSLFNEN